MKLLKNPVVAVLLSLVIVVASTLVSVNLRFGAKCQAVTDGFYDGVDSDGYRQQAMATHLKNIGSYVDGLLTIAKHYDVDSAALQSSLDIFKAALRNQNSVSNLYETYTAMMRDESALEAALAQQELSDRDAEGYALYASEISGARSAMEITGYNESVRTFLLKYKRFPTDTLAALSGVSYPEYFA